MERERTVLTRAGGAAECAVCLGEMRGWRKRLPCGHAFHARCIDAWARRRWTCPTCRRAVPPWPSVEWHSARFALLFSFYLSAFEEQLSGE